MYCDYSGTSDTQALISIWCAYHVNMLLAGRKASTNMSNLEAKHQVGVANDDNARVRARAQQAY